MIEQTAANVIALDGRNELREPWVHRRLRIQEEGAARFNADLDETIAVA
jgi:hypothetical protein